jgi:hypothetical protein
MKFRMNPSSGGVSGTAGADESELAEFVLQLVLPRRNDIEIAGVYRPF